MSRYFAILALCSLLACELGSWLGRGRCSVMRCDTEMSATYSVSGDCSISACPTEGDCFRPVAENEGCEEQPDGPVSSCCVPCSPNCCLFLVPVYGFEALGMLEEESNLHPQGKQNRYPLPFYPSVWHPPARLV